MLADPMFVVIQYTFYNKKYSLPVILTLIPMMAGIVMNSWFDIEFSPVGTTYGLASVLVTAVYTVWIGRDIQKINTGVVPFVANFFSPRKLANYLLWPLFFISRQPIEVS